MVNSVLLSDPLDLTANDIVSPLTLDLFLTLQDGSRNHIETSPLICGADQCKWVLRGEGYKSDASWEIFEKITQPIHLISVDGKV